MGPGISRATARNPQRVAALVAALLLAALFQATDPPDARASARPDLVVPSVTAPRTVTVGGRVRTAVKVANRGAAPAPRSAVQLYLGYDERLDNGGIKLGRPSLITGLAAGQSRTVTVRRPVPRTAPFEKLVLVACVDPARRIAEQEEGNNCRAAGHLVEVVGAPDVYDKIDAAVESGAITPQRGLVLKVYADVGDPALPERFGPVPTTLDSGPAIAEAAATWDELGPATQDVLAPYFAPPAYDTSTTGDRRRRAQTDCTNQGEPPLGSATYSSVDTEHFRFWYYTVNPDPRILAPPRVSRAAAETLAEVAEHVWDIETSLWREPLSDEGLPCSGGDGRVDIYLIHNRLSLTGQALPYLPGRVHRPGWAFIAPGVDDIRDVFAHEFAHIIQLAYTHPDSPRQWLEYGWLEEASATWAMDYVYPGDDYEHQFDQYLRWWGYQAPLGECIYSQCGNGYRDWIYFYFLSKHLDPSVMTRIWDQSETHSSVAALNLALGGDFGPVFAEFALRGLNRENYDDFRAWDGFTPAIPFGPKALPYTDVRLEGRSRRTLRMAGAANGRFLEPRSYKTDQYDFTDPDIRRIELRDFGYRADPGHPDVRLKAWYRLADGSHVTEDWTDLDHVEFCRDEPDEDIEKLVLFYVHGEPREYLVLGPAEFPKRTATIKVAKHCEPPAFPERWTGTANGTATYGTITQTWNGTFELAKRPGSWEQFTSYGVIPGTGTWSWSISGTTQCPGGGAPRTVSGSYSREFWPPDDVSPDLPAGDQLVLYGPDAGPLYGHSDTFHVNLNPATPDYLHNVVTYGACQGTPSEVKREYIAMNCVRDADSDYQPYTAEMTTIAGSRSYGIDVGCGGSAAVTATWNLTAAD